MGSAHARALLKYAQEANAGSDVAQDDREIRPLEAGKPMERELAGGQGHSYRIELISGQYLRVVVYQKGIDVAVTVFGPNGNKVAEIDSPNGMNGPEPISVIAEAGGTYSLEVRSREKTVAAGRYEVNLEELREATARDKTQLAAELVFAEAEQLRRGTVEAKRKGIEKYHEALALYRSAFDFKGEAQTLNNIGVTYWLLSEMPSALRYYNEALQSRRAADDKAGEAQTLNNIGMVHWSSGDMPTALDYFNKALPLRRAAGDQAGEANTLNNLGLVYDSLGDKQKALDYYRQSLIPRRASGDRESEAGTLNNMGMA
ncbi:MAG: tetratricopeptide repeat protein, partial [Blastocatellia bacterium]